MTSPDPKPAPPQDPIENLGARNWRRLATVLVMAFGMVLALQLAFGSGVHERLTDRFWLFLTIGFLAQLVDGVLGMGYGVTAAIGLIALNVPAATMSSSIHTAEIFAAGASGYSHYRFGNVRRDLFRALVIPGILGAVGGAWLLIWLDGQGSMLVKPILAAYAMLLGLRILWRTFVPTPPTAAGTRQLIWLAGLGGFLDAFGGGGWGPLVTGTLISKGNTPRYVIGSVSLSEFFITLASAFTFVSFLGLSHWPVILALALGGVVAAPVGALLAGRLPRRTMGVAVGLMIIFWSILILIKTFR